VAFGGRDRADLWHAVLAVSVTATASGPENGPDGFVLAVSADADHRRGRDALDLSIDFPLWAGKLGDCGQLGLGDRLAVSGWLLVGRWLGEQLVEVTREVALEDRSAPLLVLLSASFRARYSWVAGSWWARVTR
jgi:hypothetical protein